MEHARARLPKGEQKKFLIEAIINAGGVNTLATILNVSPRTIRDWRREKFLMPHATLLWLAQTYKIPPPQNIALEPQFWYAAKGARAGGLASYKKQGGVIGDPEIRKQHWRAWWETKGKFTTKICRSLAFHKPQKSTLLAEFIGIAMGDGGMTKRQITITLHHIDDLAYSKFVAALIKKLFYVIPAIYHHEKDSVNNIVISRSGLVQHLHTLGLPIGNKVKQCFDIPQWIQENEKYMIACIRGLVDTDGSLFVHTYRVNGKYYSYKKLSFCSSSSPLRNTVSRFLQNHGFHIRTAQEVDLRIESKAGIEHYMHLIGSHNEKHLKKWRIPL